ncbi:hypothetical protein ACFOMD_08725 [Sphingoaurantiacus capsulatus]|uniref:Uncharacterized protein n=1 Tax=Sphingoaurantiacus capsulatus TaxID=1771310 RepID=A0ABV7XBK0_9SPHN
MTPPEHKASAERRGRIVRGIWAACLLLAGLNHARTLLQHGVLWDYHGVGGVSAAYWSSLTVIDPLIAVLLLVRPRIGVPAALLVISTNVAHNLAVTTRRLPEGALFGYVASSPQLLSQIAFLIFVVVTWRWARIATISCSRAT